MAFGNNALHVYQLPFLKASMSNASIPHNFFSKFQSILSGLFLSIYLITVLRNLLIILVISSEHQFHNPMYFFLAILSISGVGLINTIVPKMLGDIQSHSRAISYVGCLTQMSFAIIFGNVNATLLTVMACDKFVSICHPLKYTGIMNPHVHALLNLVSFLISILESQVHTLIASQFSSFKDVDIHNFYCDPSQVFCLDCCEMLNKKKKLALYFAGSLFMLFLISEIIFSYYKIISSILRIISAGGKHKAFSTRGSQLCIVCLFYGTAIGVYLGSTVSYSPRQQTVASVMYSVVTPC
ncbi:PREDICTED: olfactory receptor 7E24-like [Dipodomys ordii]|uniref:Olfactory receptor 7E24-like n=1 Tax=Dipodomys ordii TaxID=10020 RepID=A0A1S3GR38_DIPOR|nr:PREDICTED: olfactory receptor 7E24-like [Dipodomys ordii]